MCVCVCVCVNKKDEVQKGSCIIGYVVRERDMHLYIH